MKLLNHIYTTNKALLEFIQKQKLQEKSSILIQIFSGNISRYHFMAVAKQLKSFLPNAHIIGTTTGGEIQNAIMLDETTLISFAVFDKTALQTAFYDFNKYKYSAQEIANELVKDDLKALIIFSDGLKSDAEPFLKELQEHFEGVAIAGGRAGDNMAMKQSYIFNDEHFSDNGFIIAALYSQELYVTTNYFLNWTALGKEMVVTKASGNILYEIDGKPTVEIYKKYLGEKVADSLPQSAMLFPLITKKGSIEVARDPIALLDNGAMMYAGHFEVGDTVRFSFADFENIIEILQNYYQKLTHFPSEAIFVYSCVARKKLFGDKLSDELILLESLAPSAGFFTYGEFYQDHDYTELLNITTTFMMLSETPNIHHKDYFVDDQNIEDEKQILAHLVKVTTQELAEIATRDALTGLYNKAEYVKRIKSKIKSAKRYGESFGIIILDIDHFKKINDTYGHKDGDEVLKAIAKVLTSTLREDDFIARWGGEEFVVIANNVNKEKLIAITKKLQNAIRDIEFKKAITASFGLTLYHEDDTFETIFKRADEALYKAKADGRDRFILL